MKFRLAGAGLLALTLWACGQKGALYLPDRTGTVITRPAGAPAPGTPPPQGQPAATPQSTPDPGATTPDKSRDPQEDDNSGQPPRPQAGQS